MSKWGEVDTRNLQKLQRRMEQLSAQDLDEFCRAGAKELAARLLRKVKKRTPVGQYPKGSGQTGGTLRRGWIKGRFMMTESEIELEAQAPRILERKLEKLLMGVLSGK